MTASPPPPLLSQGLDPALVTMYISPFRMAIAVLKHELSSDRVQNSGLQRNKHKIIVRTQGPGTHFCARILERVLEKRVCSH